MTAVGEYAFSPYAPRITQEAREFRKTITRITLPESVCEIGKNAFCYCDKLRSVNIPHGVTEIAEGIFFRCLGLEEIEIPEGVKIINNDAFMFCNSLKSIVIPEGVEQIPYGMFDTCAILMTVELPNSLRTFAQNTLVYTANVNLTFTVPKNSAAEEFCKERGYKFVYK